MVWNELIVRIQCEAWKLSAGSWITFGRSAFPVYCGEGRESTGRRVLIEPTTSADLRQRFGVESMEFGTFWAEVSREIVSIHAVWAEVRRAEDAGSLRVQ